jgi:hypothetical protein
VTALAIDLVHEFDGDESYPLALQDVWDATDVPLALLSTMHSALDQPQAARLRAHGIPVLEGARSGLVALSHLASFADRTAGTVAPQGDPAGASVVDTVRAGRWRARLSAGPLDAAASFELLADYGLTVPETAAVRSADEAASAAERIGLPVVLKCDDPAVAHKSDVDGVRLGLRTADEVRAAYLDLAGRLGPAVSVSAMVTGDVELALGLVRDPLLGPLVLVAAGGVLVELADDRAVLLPPVSADLARRVLARLKVSRLLAGYRGQPAADLDAVVAAITGLSALAVELGDGLDALDVNPVLAGPSGCVAVDALVVPR